MKIYCLNCRHWQPDITDGIVGVCQKPDYSDRKPIDNQIEYRFQFESCRNAKRGAERSRAKDCHYQDAYVSPKMAILFYRQNALERLRAYLQHNKLTRREFAELAGFDPDTVTNWFVNNRIPNKNNCIRLDDWLDWAEINKS